MKKYILGILMLASLVSCNKPTEEMKLAEARDRIQGDLQYTIQIDSLKEVWGRDTLAFHFDKDAEVHSKWMFDLWWGDADGNVPASGGWIEASGHGVRFTPIDPSIPNGEQVLRPFTWFIEQGSNKIIANIGGNRAEISVVNGSVLIHQIAGPRINEVERWYHGRQVTNGLYMKGNGAKRPG